MVKHDSLHIQMKNVVFLSYIENALKWNMNTYTLYDYEKECNDNITISTIKQMLKDYCMCNLYNRELKNVWEKAFVHVRYLNIIIII